MAHEVYAHSIQVHSEAARAVGANGVTLKIHDKFSLSTKYTDASYFYLCLIVLSDIGNMKFSVVFGGRVRGRLCLSGPNTRAYKLTH